MFNKINKINKINIVKTVIITLHGGNFVGGSANWDKQQNKEIEISINSDNYYTRTKTRYCTI